MRKSIACAATMLCALGMAGGSEAAENLSLAPLTAATVPASKYDEVFSVCGYSHSADQPSYNIKTDNLISPAGATVSYFESRGILPNFATGLGAPEPILVKILKSPEHGKLVAQNEAGITFTYYANQGYLGVDQMAFEVEVMGKKFKVMQTVVIQNSGNLDSPTDAAKDLFDKFCPSDNRSSLDIIELPPMVSVPERRGARLEFPT